MASCWRTPSDEKPFALLAGASLLLLVHRLAAALTGVAIPVMLRDQLFLLSMAGFAGGLLGIRSWLAAGALALAGAIVASALGDRTTEIFAATIMVGGVVIAVEPLLREQTPRE